MSDKENIERIAQELAALGYPDPGPVCSPDGRRRRFYKKYDEYHKGYIVKVYGEPYTVAVFTDRAEARNVVRAYNTRPKPEATS